MVGTAIVAIPKEDDYVWKISSEKIPHLTMLFLGDQSKNANLSKIVDFVDHVANTELFRFGLDVDRRGVLGPDEADVLFFNDRWMMKDVARARDDLLKNDNIKAAFNSVAQFPEWTPHLTLGFPATPAKPDTRDWPGTSFVGFDKIAVWTGDFEGPTFDLKEKSWDMDMAMSDAIDGILSHHGVKGQKWGVRRTRSETGVTKLKRGASLPATEDATRANKAHAIAKTSGTAALSNKDLQHVVNRINLERQFAKLSPSTLKKGQAAAKDILEIGKTLNEIHQFTRSPAGKTIKDNLK